MKLGNFESALMDAKAASAMDPNFWRAYLRIAACEIIFGRFESACTNLDLAAEHADEKGQNEVLKERERLSRLIKMLADSERNWEKKDWRAAAYFAGQVIESCPKNFDLIARKAEALVYLKKFEEALNLANDVLRKDEQNEGAVWVRALCLYYQDSFEKAGTFFKRLLQLSPDNSKYKDYWKKMKTIKAKKDAGSELLKSGNSQEALNKYQEALAIDQTNDEVNAKILFNIALCQVKLKQPKEALESLNSALAMKNDYLKASMKRVQVQMELEMFEEAVREAESIFRKDRSQNAKQLLDDAKSALKRSKHKDYYKILGVAKNATEDDIKKAYKKKALVHHPDRHANSSESEKKENEKKFKGKQCLMSHKRD